VSGVLIEIILTSFLLIFLEKEIFIIVNISMLVNIINKDVHIRGAI